MLHKLYESLSRTFSLKQPTWHDETERDGHNPHCPPVVKHTK